MEPSNYLTDLKTLADCQQEEHRTVLFRVTIVPVGNKAEVTFRTLKADGKTAVTGEPLLRQMGIGQLALWESFGYIKVVTGSLKQRMSTIRLTESGIDAAASL